MPHAKSYAVVTAQGVKRVRTHRFEKCSKARRVPTETGFKLRVALPRPQQSKGYLSVTFRPIAGPYQAYPLEHDRHTGPRRTANNCRPTRTAAGHFVGPTELAPEEFRQPQRGCAGYENFWGQLLPKRGHPHWRTAIRTVGHLKGEKTQVERFFRNVSTSAMATERGMSRFPTLKRFWSLRDSNP